MPFTFIDAAAVLFISCRKQHIICTKLNYGAIRYPVVSLPITTITYKFKDPSSQLLNYNIQWIKRHGFSSGHRQFFSLNINDECSYLYSPVFIFLRLVSSDSETIHRNINNAFSGFDQIETANIRGMRRQL